MYPRRLAVCLSLLLCLNVVVRLPAAPPPAAPTQIRIPLWIDPPQDRLDPRDVQLTVNGKPAQVARILDPSNDLVVLLVLDLTGDITLIDKAKAALVWQIDALPQNAWVGLLKSDDFSVLCDPTPDRGTLDDAIRSLPVTGKAGLLDTVTAVSRLGDKILRKSGVRVAILYVTDSDITNYREDFTNPIINSSDPHDLSRKFPEALIQEKISTVENQIASNEPPLFIVHLQYRSTRMNQAYQNGLKTLAESTAGYGYFCRSTAEIDDAIQKAFRYMQSSWLLTIALPKPTPAAVQLRLQLPSRNESHLAYRARLLTKRK
jgi:hypothetical protein